MPHLKELLQRYQDQGLALISINVLEQENHLLKAWAVRRKLDHPILTAPADVNLIQRYHVAATPTNYLLDGESWPIKRWQGFHEQHLHRMEEEVRRLLGIE